VNGIGKHVKQSGLRSTARLLREAATPEVYLRAFKTLKQGTPAGTTIGIVTANTQRFDKWWGVLLGALGPIWAAVQSFADNTVDNAQKLLNDAPTQKEEV
jgi:hypothetical protein